MASQKVALEVEVQGVEQSIESVKDLKNAIKAAKDEQVKAASAFGESSKEFQQATQKVSALKDKVDDLADSTKSLKGSGVERASEGFNQLGEGLRNLDFDKVKVGFAAMKTALAAVGIGLIVQLVSYLIENFDELSKGSGGLAVALRFVADIIGRIIATGQEMITFVTDLIDVTSKASRAMEAQGEAMVKAANQTKIALQEQIKEFDNQIAAAKAAGESTVELEIAKQNAIIETNKQIALQVVEQIRLSGTVTDEQKKLAIDSINNIKAAEQAKKLITITANKETNDKIAEQNKAADEEKKKQDAILLAESDAFWNAELALQKGYATEKYILDKKEIDDQIALEEAQRLQDEAMVAGTQARNEQARLDKIAKDKAARDAELAGYAELEKEKFNLTKQGLDGVQALSDMYFLFKSQKAQKGSKEEEELAKKAFNVNKALQLATATVNGIQSVQGAFTTATASPITTVFPAYPFIQAGLAGVFAAANIAKIAASKFGGGGGGSVAPSGGAPTTPSIPPPPTIATPENNTNKTTSFDETGKNLNFQGTPTPTINVKASVGVDEITSKSNRVEVLEQQSTF